MVYQDINAVFIRNHFILPNDTCPICRNNTFKLCLEGYLVIRLNPDKTIGDPEPTLSPSVICTKCKTPLNKITK